jgi:hypothetical protein
LNAQRGHCHVPCRHSIGVGQRQHSSVSVTVSRVGGAADALARDRRGIAAGGLELPTFERSRSRRAFKSVSA